MGGDFLFGKRWCPHVESNHDFRLRRPTVYPLTYEDKRLKRTDISFTRQTLWIDALALFIYSRYASFAPDDRRKTRAHACPVFFHCLILFFYHDTFSFCVCVERKFGGDDIESATDGAICGRVCCAHRGGICEFNE